MLGPAGVDQLATVDPFVVVAAGRALFRPADLLALAVLVRDLRGGQDSGRAGTVGVKGISPGCKGDDAVGSLREVGGGASVGLARRVTQGDGGHRA